MVESNYALRVRSHLCDLEASEEASCDIFRCVTVNGEGVPRERIYKDDWLMDDYDEEDENDIEELRDSSDNKNSDPDIGNERKKKINPWISGLPAAGEHTPLAHQNSGLPLG